MDIERYLESPVIAVRVGKNEVTFNIHKSLLMEKSALFRNHLQIRGNANAPSMKISIVEDGRHFAPFAVWMYNEHEDVLDTKSKPPYHFGQLWTLAEEIESNDYLNFLADRIQRLLGTANIDFSVKSYDELLSVRRGDSAMGKFIIDCMAYSVATKGFQQIIGDDSNSTQAGEWFGVVLSCCIVSSYRSMEWPLERIQRTAMIARSTVMTQRMSRRTVHAMESKKPMIRQSPPNPRASRKRPLGRRSERALTRFDRVLPAA